MAPASLQFLAALAAFGALRAAPSALSDEAPVLLHTLEDAATIIRSLSYSSDGRTLVSGSLDREVRLYDASLDPPEYMGAVREALEDVRMIALSPDGATLATASGDSVVRLYDTSWEPPILTHELDDAWTSVWSCSFSPDGRYLATGSADDKVRIYDMQEGADRSEVVAERKEASSIRTLNFSPDSRFLATGGGDGNFRLYDMGAAVGTWPELVANVNDGTKHVWTVRFSVDGRFLATANSDNLIKLYDLTEVYQHRAPRHVVTISDAEDDVRTLAFSPDGRYLASGGMDMRLRVYYLSEPQPTKVADLKDGMYFIIALAFNPTSTRLAVGCGGGDVRIYRVPEIEAETDEVSAGNVSDAGATNLSVLNDSDYGTPRY